MRIDVLGVLRIRSAGGVERALPGEKARAMLRLLVAAGRPCSVATISDFLWDGEPPRSSLPNIQTYASRIRAVLPLAYASGAYVLRLEPGESDLLDFAGLVDRGRSAMAHDPRLAAGLFRGAVEMWHGPPLGPATSGRADGIARRWEETRVAAYAALVSATHDPASLIGDLLLLAAEYPYRESVQELLLRVLYRSGDAALALDAYHRFRRALGEEMGVEPGSRLRRVYEAILREEPHVANV